MALDDTARQLVDGANFAVVATADTDGAPQTSVVWIGLDGDTVVFTSTATRKKTRNILRNPRVSLTVLDATNPYRTVDIRGRAEVTPDPEKTLRRRLSHKYLGQDSPPESTEIERVIVRVTPEKITHHAP